MISIENASLESLLGEMLGALLGIYPSVGHTLYFTPKATLARLDMLARNSEGILDKACTVDWDLIMRVSAKRGFMTPEQVAAVRKPSWVAWPWKLSR